MSVIVEDLANPSLQAGASSPSRISASDRPLLMRMGTKKLMRLDSPTTVQACNELGIFPDDLKQKGIDEFRDPNVEEALVQLRFNHYMKRFNQTLKDVATKRKQIARKLRNQQLELQISSEQRKSTGSSPAPGHYFTAGAMTTTGSPQAMNKPSTPFGSFSYTSPVAVNFNKTVTYLRKSHGSPEIKNLEDIIGNEDNLQTSQNNSPLSSFRKTLSQEVTKFNKLKKMKQKEAKEVYETDLKRVKLFEEEKEREEKRKEREKKLALAKKKKDEERKRIFEDKADRIKESEKMYEMNKYQEKIKMKERLEAAKRKFEEETEQKKRAILEREMRMEMKMREARDRRERCMEDELRACDQLKANIDEKMFSKEERHRMNLHQKSQSVKARLDQVEENVARNKERQEQEMKEYVQRLTSKLVKEEEAIRTFRDKYMKDVKKREASLTEKDKRLESHQKDLDGHYKERMAEINERFQRVQENLETKRQVDEQNRKLKGEQNRLKLQDKLENHSRLQRKLQFERLKILDKEKHDQEKVYWLKSHREFTQKAKLEVAIQSKIEKDFIEGNVNQLSKLVYGANSTRSVTDSQRRILKTVLKPEDYREIEEEEKRKEAEKKIKLGQIEDLNSPPFTQLANPLALQNKKSVKK